MQCQTAGELISLTLGKMFSKLHLMNYESIWHHKNHKRTHIAKRWEFLIKRIKTRNLSIEIKKDTSIIEGTIHRTTRLVKPRTIRTPRSWVMMTTVPSTAQATNGNSDSVIRTSMATIAVPSEPIQPHIQAPYNHVLIVPLFTLDHLIKYQSLWMNGKPSQRISTTAATSAIKITGSLSLPSTILWKEFHQQLLSRAVCHRVL